MHTFKLPPSLLPASPHRLLSRRSSSRSSRPNSTTSLSNPNSAKTSISISNSASISSSPAAPSTPKIGATTHVEMFSPADSDAQCWERMVALQREYRCYNSARLEAAVEARERGEMGGVLVPSRLCLDLMNESLKAWIDAYREGLVA